MAKADSGITETVSWISGRVELQSTIHDRFDMIKPIVITTIICIAVLFSFSLWLVDRREDRIIKFNEFYMEHAPCPSKTTGKPMVPDKI